MWDFVRIKRAVCGITIVNLIWYNFLFKLTLLTFLECKHEAGCIRSGHLLLGESRPNFIVLILGRLHPDLSSSRCKKSWCNLSDIQITDFHNISIIIWGCFSISPTSFYIRSAAVTYMSSFYGTKLKNQVPCYTSMAKQQIVQSNWSCNNLQFHWQISAHNFNVTYVQR